MYGGIAEPTGEETKGERKGMSKRRGSRVRRERAEGSTLSNYVIRQGWDRDG